MSRLLWAVCSLVAAGLLLAGCVPPQVLLDELEYTEILGADGQSVLLLEFGGENGWTGSAASLWQLDVSTGELRQVQEAQEGYALAGSGDYFLTLAPGAADTARLVGHQISTSEEFTVAENVLGEAGYNYAEVLLDGTRVAMLTTEGLEVFDLEQRAITSQMGVPATTSGLAAFSNGHVVLLTYGVFPNTGTAINVLVDLDTGEQIELAPPADLGGSEFLTAVSLSDSWVAAEGSAVLDSSTDQEWTEVTRILTFHIPTQTWREVAETQTVYNVDSALWPVNLDLSYVSVAGLNETYVLLAQERIGSVLGGTDWLELVNIETGQVTEVPGSRREWNLIQSPDDASAVLQGQQVYWIDAQGHTLSVYDIASGETRDLGLAF